MLRATVRPAGVAAWIAAAASIGLAADPARAADPASGAGTLVDVTASAGIAFQHATGGTGLKDYRETMGSGACLFDADGDGRLDVYLVNAAGPNRLYRNLGGMRFRDVTEAAGCGDAGYGMGAVAADVDGDGDQDLFVTNFGPNRLYRNRGDGTFDEVSAAAGLDHPAWGCGAAFLDADGDGDLDLFVANYVDVASPDTLSCLARDGVTRLVCKPTDYPAQADVFFRNRGDGAFEDATADAGLDGAPSRGLGVVVLDFDDDGHPDLYVANDLDPNHLFRNDGAGRFEDVGFFAGTSHSEGGRAESGMGVAAADYDNDGRTDLFVTNFVGQTNTLYHNEGDGFFQDETSHAGLGSGSLPFVGWGTAFPDLDRDGFRDLIVVNGHVEPDAAALNDPLGYRQPDLVYRNRGDGTFEDVTARWAPGFAEEWSSRGAAVGDLDNDGDDDVLVVNQNGPARVFENRIGDAAWIGVTVREVGARVTVYAPGSRSRATVTAGSSFLCGEDPRLRFGLGSGGRADSVVVEWRDGERAVLPAPELQRYHWVVRP